MGNVPSRCRRTAIVNSGRTGRKFWLTGLVIVLVAGVGVGGFLAWRARAPRKLAGTRTTHSVRVKTTVPPTTRTTTTRTTLGTVLASKCPANSIAFNGPSEFHPPGVQTGYEWIEITRANLAWCEVPTVAPSTTAMTPEPIRTPSTGATVYLCQKGRIVAYPIDCAPTTPS
jgi:hypothetical protein